MTHVETSLWLNGILSDAYQPRPDESTLDWAGKHVYVPPEVSPEFPGFYGLGPTPLVDILFEFYDSPEWDEFFCPKSSQYGLSQGAHVCILKDAKFRGKNIILTLDSRDEAKRVSQTRLQPMIRHCETLGSKVSEDADDFTNLTLRLKGLTIFLMGSHSPTALANKTAGFAVADEVDNYPERPKDESNAIDLLRDRLKKVVGSKLIAFSKPKNANTIIWPEYLTGSRHKCFLPCPHCGEKQELVWEQVRFDHCKNALCEWDYERVMQETYYECLHCKEPIEEHHKEQMIAGREWRATNDGKDAHKPKPRKMSAHISDLYATTAKDTWGHLAVEWLDAQLTESKRMAFKRGRLALPWEEAKIEVDSTDIRRMVGGYERGTCPMEPDIILMASDYQEKKLEKKWIKTGWRLEDETCWVIDYGICHAFDELLQEADKPVEILQWNDETPEADRVNPTVYKGFIDEGYDQTGVRDWVIETYLGQTADGNADYRFYPCWGRAGVQTAGFKDMWVTPKTPHKGWPLVSYYFNEWLFKQELFNNRIGRFREIEDAIKKGNPVPRIPRIWFPSKIDDDFVSELCQEAKVWDEKKKKWVWRDPTKPNDFGDALKMNLVLWFVMMPYLQQQKMVAHELARQRKEAEAKGKQG